MEIWLFARGVLLKEWALCILQRSPTELAKLMPQIFNSALLESQGFRGREWSLFWHFYLLIKPGGLYKCKSVSWIHGKWQLHVYRERTRNLKRYLEKESRRKCCCFLPLWDSGNSTLWLELWSGLFASSLRVEMRACAWYIPLSAHLSEQATSLNEGSLTSASLGLYLFLVPKNPPAIWVPQFDAAVLSVVAQSNTPKCVHGIVPERWLHQPDVSLPGAMTLWVVTSNWTVYFCLFIYLVFRRVWAFGQVCLAFQAMSHIHFVHANINPKFGMLLHGWNCGL